jgi:hypothetical protein
MVARQPAMSADRAQRERSTLTSSVACGWADGVRGPFPG